VENIVFVLFYNEELEALEKTKIWHPALSVRRNDKELRLYVESLAVHGLTYTDLESCTCQIFLSIDV